MVIKARGGKKGYQIQLENGKIQPKVYPTKGEAEAQIARMKKFKHIKKNK